MRTQNFLKEKGEIRVALENARADLKAADKSQRGNDSESSKLKQEIDGLT